MQPMQIPQGCTLARQPSRGPDHEEPALLRDADGRVLASVEMVGGETVAFAVERVRRYLRVT